MNVAVLALQVALAVVMWRKKASDDVAPAKAASDSGPHAALLEDDNVTKQRITNMFRLIQESGTEMPEAWRTYIDRRCLHQFRNLMSGPLLEVARQELKGATEDASRLRACIVRAFSASTRRATSESGEIPTE